MSEFFDGKNYRCPECGEILSDAFAVVEHMLDDGEEFNPSMILPGGFRLLLGSLLRGLYDNRDDAKYIGEITQSSYLTLFTAEVHPEMLGETVQDIIVESVMEDFDGELKQLFKNRE
jgi:hypothetical protein